LHGICEVESRKYRIVHRKTQTTLKCSIPETVGESFVYDDVKLFENIASEQGQSQLKRGGRAGSLTQEPIIASTEPKLSSVILLRVLAIATMDTKSNENGIENDENATLEACSSNDLATLQRLLDDNGQQPGNYQLDIRKLFAAAVASKQTTIVEFLLQKYPTYSF
jgi:hypothetical protein